MTLNGFQIQSDLSSEKSEKNIFYNHHPEVQETDRYYFGRLMKIKVLKVDSLRKLFPDQREQPLINFCTGSKYTGQIDNLGFCGQGRYVYPHGVVYEGEFNNGEFHGKGILTYPSGFIVKGEWVKGRRVKTELKSQTTWPDRSYEIERQEGFSPPGQEYICSSKPDPVIPPSTYDNADGTYYSEEKKVICDYKEHRIKNIVQFGQEEFIKEKFRQEKEKPTGYAPELYERWCSGRAKEVEKYIAYFNKIKHKKQETIEPVEETQEPEKPLKSNTVFVVKGRYHVQVMT